MIAYQTQLNKKTARLTALLAPFGAPPVQVFPSPEQHYRMRAEFRIWHEGDTLSYAMFERGQKASSASLVRLTGFPAACESINRLMMPLLQRLSGCPVLKTRLYQCEFLATLGGELLVTLIYHRKLDDEWRTAAAALQNTFGIGIIGRSKGQKIVLGQDFVTEKLTVCGETFSYRQTEGSFSQPNARICEKMLEWACRQVEGIGGDLLELYCGNGNFTLPLSRRFARVLATEISKTSVAAAQWGIAANHAGNVKIARLSAEELAEAFSGCRDFRRLAEQGIRLADYAFSTVFVDPPRAGIDADTLALISRFPNIIYISCNPDTLAANLGVLAQTHEIAAAALFDQFPYTPHIESGVLLRKKAGKAA